MARDESNGSRTAPRVLDDARAPTERVWRPGNVIDLGGAARPAPIPVPRLSGATNGDRHAPAYARTSSVAGARLGRDMRADDGRALGEARARMREQSLTRSSILERYRGDGRAAPARPAHPTPSPRATDGGLSRLRGAVVPPAPAPRALTPTRTRSSSAAVDRRGTSVESRARAAQSGTARAIRERKGVQRLQKLHEQRPERARDTMRRGESVSVATHVGVQVAIGTTLACSGVSGGSTFWDPCHGPSSCSPWVGSCSPYSWWWWNGLSYGFPCWGFNACYSNFGLWWGSPYCRYPYAAYYCPPPVYYSYVIYDTVEPQPAQQEVVVYEQPGASTAVGEGSLGPPSAPIPSPTDPALTDALSRSAGHYLTLGDRAFRDGRYGDAVHFYAKAIEYSPDEGVLHLILSDALFATGDYHYAAYALRRALELDARLVDSVVDKHTFYSDPGEFDTQLMLLERYVQDHFLDDDARLLLAANYLFGGRADASIEMFESPFSVEVRDSTAGSLLLERARRIAQGASGEKR